MEVADAVPFQLVKAAGDTPHARFVGAAVAIVFLDAPVEFVRDFSNVSSALSNFLTLLTALFHAVLLTRRHYKVQYLRLFQLLPAF